MRPKVEIKCQRYQVIKEKDENVHDFKDPC